MEMSSVIQGLNELEKLKLLLFDQDQYFIFEHIPKPFLMDLTVTKRDKELPEDSPETPKSTEGASTGGGDDIFISRNAFWEKSHSDEQKIMNFKKALKNIMSKKRLNVIDHRLLRFMDQFGSDSEDEGEEQGLLE